MSLNSNKSKGLSVVGALAFLAGAVAIHQSTETTDDSSSSIKVTSADTRDRIGADLRSEGTEVVGDDESGEYKVEPTLSVITPLDILRNQALRGSFEAAKILIDSYDARKSAIIHSPNDKEENDTHGELLREFGISEEQYQIFVRATDFKAHMALINNDNEKLDEEAQEQKDLGVKIVGGDDITEVITGAQYQLILQLLCYQAATPEGAFDPLFLQLIGKNNQELKDFVREVDDYFQGREASLWEKHLAYLRYHYLQAETDAVN